MKNFTDAFNALIGNEGGYVNNPNDPGGETMWGVTKRVALANGYTGQMKDLPRATAMLIAKKAYWDVIQGDQFDPNIAFQLFDAAYNHGVKTPSVWLQKSAGLTGDDVDGSIGRQTIAAVTAFPWYQIVFRFNSQRAMFYTSTGTWATFGKGWTNRIANNLSIAGEQS